MSELINKSKIAALEQSNYELTNKILDLQDELENLNREMERLKKENPDDIEHLREIVSTCKQREAEMEARILSITKIAKNHNKKDDVVKQLLSILQGEDSSAVETLVEQYYKKKELPKFIIAFLLGIVVSLVAWLVVGYLENDEFYNTIIKWVKGNIS